MTLSVIIDIHTHQLKETKENEFFIFNQTGSFYTLSTTPHLSIGIHPWHINSEWKESVKLIEQHLSDPRVVALGEAGLDSVKGPEMKLQQEVFLKQIYLSEKYKKPLIIHCVKAFQELILIRKETRAVMPWIIHGFRSNLQIADQMLENGFNLSFGAALLTQKSLQDVFRKVSLEKIFFETDDDVSYKITDIYKKASELLKLDLKDIEKKIGENYSTTFYK